jgi:phosphoribosylformimino-5-aminoimidazole carboxamide ribotide isomerase
VRVIGVLDLQRGRAVHASGGRRDRYEPVRFVAGTPIEAGDAVALAAAYTRGLGLAELYVADLDAIVGRPLQQSQIVRLVALEAPLWVDAGVTSVARARHLVDLGAARVVVGLETLSSWAALEAICESAGGERVAFSLDLREGRPVTPDVFSGRRDEPVTTLAARAADAGVGAVIVIDLARVGAGRGPDVETIAGVRPAVPQLTLLAGGGVRGAHDLAALADAGCDAVLAATALLDGRLPAQSSAGLQAAAE